MVETATPDHARLMVQPAYYFVLAEAERILTKGNPELSRRYTLLRNYFESRLPAWDVEIKK